MCRQSAVGVNRTVITDRDARLAHEIVCKQPAQYRLMKLRPSANGNPLGMRKTLPAFDLCILAARIKSKLILGKDRLPRIGMIGCKVAPAIFLVRLKGYVLALIGAPDFMRQRDNKPLAALLHRATMRENGIILPPITLIPRKIELRREKGRAEKAHVLHKFLGGSAAKADLLQIPLHRHIDATPKIGSIQKIAVHRE